MAETANPCDVLCSLTDPKELNRLCECTLVDVMDVRESLGAGGKGATRLDPTLHANLFSPYALFVDRESLALMEAVAQATFSVAQNPMYADRVLGWAPEIARHDPGSIGGVLGLDFHLTVAGPRLIEINTTSSEESFPISNIYVFIYKSFRLIRTKSGISSIYNVQ